MVARPSNTRHPPAAPLEACDKLVLFARTPYYVLHADTLCNLFMARRTTAPFEHCADIPACFDEVARAIAGLPLPRHHFKLLVDARGGPCRNDTGFEAALLAHRGKLLRGFAKNAALAATAAGCLQIQRYAKNDGRDVFVTDSPDAAFRYLGVPSHPVAIT